ncbi:amidohydrolase [Leekyejoonella antrihumi]|uniref:Amidohydrolase n=1 Tax=Leekyejoonella antrihumi TaxID=1660198 RepID=A0A563E7Y0_9MICO|nr:amidohydrolase [Leekyejoonella antrihumi]
MRDDAAALSNDLIGLRHRLHQHPEIGLALPVTQQLVLEALDGLPLEITTGQALTSVTAVLRGGRTRDPAERAPAVLLRGDMDGLPVTEQTGLPYTSQVEGAMHACGHDLHTAMLVGAARLLSAHREELAGDVVFMFQPGEEGFDGAGHMIREGVLDAAGSRVDSAYGMHVYSTRFPRGSFTTRPGILMAASDGLEVTVHGRGGHGSMPHLSLDPVSVAAEIITALQTMVTRRMDVFDPVVITIGSFHAGTRRNIIPDDAAFEATIRTFSPASRDQLRELAPRLCQQIAAAHGLTADAKYHDEYPPTVNNSGHAAFAAGVVREVFGDRRFADLPHPSPGAEDFSRVLEEVPGCYLFLGAHAGDDPAGQANNHSPRAAFVDDVIPDGVLLHAQLAIRALERDANTRTGDAAR